MTDTLKFLKKEIAKSKVDDRTVVIFDRTINTRYNQMRMVDEVVPAEDAKTITYAAIYVGNRWFFTGKGRLGNERLTTRDFLERMAEPDITNVWVVSTAEQIA